MNRWLLFAYDRQYPSGGLRDCILMSNEGKEVVQRWRATKFEVSHVYDCETGKMWDEDQFIEFVKRYG